MTRPDSFCAGWLVLALATPVHAVLLDFSSLHESPRHTAPDTMTPWNGARKLSDEEKQWLRNWQYNDRKNTPVSIGPAHPLQNCLSGQDMTTFCRHVQWIHRHKPPANVLMPHMQEPIRQFKGEEHPRFKFFN